MKIKNILIVGITFLGLLAYIVSFEIPKSERREAESKPLHKVGKAQISALEIIKAEEKFRLVNSQPQKGLKKSKLDQDEARLLDGVSPPEWKMEGAAYPQIDAANLNAVITQLAAFNLGESLPQLELEKDLVLYGLEKPEVTLVTEHLDEYSSPKTIKFEFGKKSEFLGKRYVRYTRTDGSQDIFLTDDLLFFAANKQRKDFRRKDPINFKDSELTKIEMNENIGATKIVLEKTASQVPGEFGEHWKLTSPISSSADQGRVVETLKNLKNMKVKEFIEGDVASPSLDGPTLFANLYFKGKESEPSQIKIITKKIAETQKTYFTLSEYPVIFEAEADATAAVAVEISAFRQSQYLNFQVDNVTSFELGGSAVAASLKGEKKDELWKLADKNGDDTFIRQWFMDLKELKAKGYPSETNDYGFANPSYKLLLNFDNAGKSYQRILVVGAAEKIETGVAKSYFAGVDDLAEPFIISADDLAKITPKPETLVEVVVPTPTVAATPGVN